VAVFCIHQMTWMILQWLCNDESTPNFVLSLVISLSLLC